MANPQHLAIAKRGAAAVAEWRSANLGTRLNLSGADLSGADLSEADLFQANLVGANLSHANLSQAELLEANLSHANLLGANLLGADLFLADLTWANLSMAILSRLVLAEVSTGRTIFTSCDLSEATGLETIQHLSPSSIGVDTLVQTLRGAGGTFTEVLLVFFENAGVPRSLLDNLPGLIEAEPLKFYSTFISHGSEDREFAEKLYSDLTSRGVQCWIYQKDALIGRNRWANIDQAIKVYDKVIVICSRNSLNSSPVLREIEPALQKEDRLKKEGAKDTDVLFPIRRDLDHYVTQEWQHHRKDDVVEKHMGDFRDSSRYEEELDGLIRALDPRSWPPTHPR